MQWLSLRIPSLGAVRRQVAVMQPAGTQDTVTLMPLQQSPGTIGIVRLLCPDDVGRRVGGKVGKSRPSCVAVCSPGGGRSGGCSGAVTWCHALHRRMRGGAQRHNSISLHRHTRMEPELTERELEVVMAVFKSYEVRRNCMLNSIIQ